VCAHFLSVFENAVVALVVVLAVAVVVVAAAFVFCVILRGGSLVVLPSIASCG
jgi:hypothetical protein